MNFNKHKPAFIDEYHVAKKQNLCFQKKKKIPKLSDHLM